MNRFLLLFLMFWAAHSSLFAQLEFVPQIGHFGTPTALALSSDGQLIATAYTDQRLKLWSAPELALLKTFEGLGVVKGLQFLDHHRLIEVISSSGVRHIDLLSGQAVFNFQPDPTIDQDFVVQTAGRHIAVCQDEKTLNLWDGKSNRKIQDFPTSKSPYFYDFGPKDEVFFYANKEEVVFWDIKSKELRTSHKGTFQDFSFDAKRAYFAAIDEGNLLRIWSISTGKLLQSIPNVAIRHFQAKRPRYAFSPDAQLIAISAAKKAEVKIFNVNTGQLINTIVDTAAERGGMKFTFSPNGKQIYCSFSDKTVKQFSVNDSSSINSYQGYAVTALSPSGQYLLLSAGKTYWVDAQSGEVLRTLRNTPRLPVFSQDENRLFYSVEQLPYERAKLCRIGKEASNRDRSFEQRSRDYKRIVKSPDGKLFATLEKGFFDVWRFQDFKHIFRGEGKGDLVHLAFRADSKGVLSFFAPSLTGPKYPMLRFSDLTARKSEEIATAQIKAGAFALSPDGKYLASAIESPKSFSSQLPYWDLKLKAPKYDAPLGANPKRSYYPMAYSPDGNWVAVVRGKASYSFGPEGKNVSLLSAKNMKYQSSFSASGGNDKESIAQLAFSPDGALLAADSGQDIEIWELATGEDFQVLKGHDALVSSFCFSADGKFLFSGALDGTVNKWEVNSGKLLQSLPHIHPGLKSIVLDEQQNRWITAGNGPELRVWDAMDGSPVFTSVILPRKYYGAERMLVSPEGVHFSDLKIEGHLLFVDSLKYSTLSTSFPLKMSSMEEFLDEVSALKRILGEDRLEVFQRFKRDIYGELQASPLFKPKSEFESEAAYRKRRETAKDFRHRIYAKYKTKINDREASLEAERIAKIRNSLEEIELKAATYGSYDPEAQRYRFQVNGQLQWVEIPAAEAASLKANSQQLKAIALRQLKEDARSFETFNVRIVHPVSGQLYPFGTQKPTRYGAQLERTRVKEIPLAREPLVNNTAKVERAEERTSPNTKSSTVSSLARPSISWLNRWPKIVNQSRLPLNAVIRSDQPLLSTTVFANNQRQNCPVRATAKGGSLNCQLRLREGMNTFYLETVNAAGKTVSDKFSVRFQPPFLRQDYALIFVTESYEDSQSWGPLANTIKGGEVLRNILTDRFGFQVELVKNPSLDEMYQYLERYAKRSYGPYDQLLISFAGHGFSKTLGSDRKIGYLVAKDSRGDSPRNYLAHSYLQTQLDAIGCPHILLLMDACFSSTFGNSIQSDITAARGKYLNRRLTRTNFLKQQLKPMARLYLTSGATEVLAGTNDQLSPFMRLLTDSLAELQPLSPVADFNLIFFSQLKERFARSGLNPTPTAGRFGQHAAAGQFLFELK